MDVRASLLIGICLFAAAVARPARADDDPAPPVAAVSSAVGDDLAAAAWRLVDGGTGTNLVWSSAPRTESNAVEWCSVRWDRVREIRGVEFWTADDSSNALPAAFTVRYCTDDGVTWYDIPALRFTNATPAADGRRVRLACPPLSARGVQVRATTLRPGPDGAFAFRLAELSALSAEERGPFRTSLGETFDADLNNFWRIFGLGLHQNPKCGPMLGGRLWWGIPVSASDLDWTELKLAWRDDGAMRRTLHRWLVELPLDTNGFAWAAADGRRHLNQHMLRHTSADFINALWEWWRWNGDADALTNAAPDYAVAVESPDGSVATPSDTTDFAHFIHGGDGLTLAQTFQAPSAFKAVRAKLAVVTNSHYELRLYAGPAAEPLARREYKGTDGHAGGWTTLPLAADSPAGDYRLELASLGGYHKERIAWHGRLRGGYGEGVSIFNGLTNLTLLQRARLAMDYQLDDAGMGGRRNGVATIADPDQSGAPQPPDRREGGSTPSTYYDLVRSGHREAFVNARFLKSLDSLARIEEALGNAAEAAALRAQLAASREAFHKTFWNPAAGRYAGWVDATGRAWDYGEVAYNLAAVLDAAPPPDAARSVFDWIDGRRTIPGDTSTGADLYAWGFAPRKNALAYESAGPAANHWWGGWFWDFRPDGTGRANFGNQEENGGTNPFLAYYDVLARIAVNGPDDAWNRFAVATNSVMAEFHRDAFDRPTKADPNHPKERFKSYVMDLPEAGLPPLVILHGFMGVTPDGRALRIAPRLPSAVGRLAVRGVGFHGRRFDIDVGRGPAVTLVAGPGQPDESVELIFEGAAPGVPYRIEERHGDAVVFSRPLFDDGTGRIVHSWRPPDGASLTIGPVP